MKKFYDIEIDSQVELENGKTLGKLEESKISVNDGNCGSGGASDPIVENAKQTGGFGYTEQGEQTVITWDGDTEGRDAFVLHSSYGDVNCYKVAEKQSEYPENASIEVTYGDVTASADVELTEYTGAYTYNAEGQPYVVIASAGDINVGGFTGNAPSDGVYFILGQYGEIITSLTYGTPDTVHKIDEKYLPASGGDFVIHVTEDDDGNLVADKTYEEVYMARDANMAIKAIYLWASYPVIAYYRSGGFSCQRISVSDDENRMDVDTLAFGFDDNDNPQITKNHTSYTLTPTD